MRAVFSEVRDFVHSKVRVVDGDRTKEVEGKDLVLLGVRPLNTMAFLICSNLPQDVPLSVHMGESNWAGGFSEYWKQVRIPSCKNRVDKRFGLVHFNFPVGTGVAIPHYANGQNHEGGSPIETSAEKPDASMFIDESLYNDSANGAGRGFGDPGAAMPPAGIFDGGFTPAMFIGGMNFMSTYMFGKAFSTIPEEYMVDSGTLNNFIPFIAPHVPGYVFKGFYTTRNPEGMQKEEMIWDQDYGTLKYDDGIAILPPIGTSYYDSHEGRIGYLDDEYIRKAYDFTGVKSFPYLAYGYVGPHTIVDRQGVEHVWRLYNGKALTAYPTDPGQYSRAVWVGGGGATEEQRRTFYGANHLLTDSQVFGFLWWRYYFGRLMETDWLERRDASRKGHFFGANGRLAIPDNISEAAYNKYGVDPYYFDDRQIVMEGTVIKYNLIMLKYAKAITVTYILNPAAGSFAEDEQVYRLEVPYELPVDTLTPSAEITVPGAVYKTNQDLRLVGWFSGPMALTVDPRKNPSVRKMDTGSRVYGDTTVWALWQLVTDIEAKPGVNAINVRESTPWNGSDPFTWRHPEGLGSNEYFSVTIWQGCTTRLSFGMVGDYTFFFGEHATCTPPMRSNRPSTWTEMIQNGDTGYYVAKDGNGNIISASTMVPGGVDLDFDFSVTPPLTYNTYAWLPVRCGSGVAKVKYTIDDGAVQTETVPATPVTEDGKVVVWINNVPSGSTVKVWGESDDSQKKVNFDGEFKTVVDPATGIETTVRNVQTFVADGSTRIVWFSFALYVDALEVREIAFDSMFLWQDFAEDALIADASAGVLAKTERSVGFSSEYWVSGKCYDGVILFAREGHDRAETRHGATYPMVPVTAGEWYSMALDVSWAAWDEDTEDPSTIKTVVETSTNNTTDHCSARVVFYDRDNGIILDGNGHELTYEIARGHVTGEDDTGDAALRGNTMDFQAPAGARHVQVILVADEGYKVQFHDVRLCTKELFDNAITTSKVYGSTLRYRKWNVKRRYLAPVVEGPCYGSADQMPGAKWNDGSLGFAKWVTSDGAVIDKDTPVQSASLALHSVWTGAHVAVLLNAMGGRFYKTEDGVKVLDPDIFYQRRNFGDTYGKLPTPECNDLRVFQGWWTAAIGGTRVEASTVVTSPVSVTLYAHWGTEPDDAKHDLFFNAVGGTVGESSREVVEGAEYGSLPEPTKARCQFLGWYTEMNGGTKVSENDRMGYYDVTIYAHWTAVASGTGSEPTGEVPAGATPVQWGYVRYTIKLVTDGGTVASGYGALKYNGGIAKALPTAAQMTKDGATFAGWYETADFSGSAVTEIPATATGTKTFYARWV